MTDEKMKVLTKRDIAKQVASRMGATCADAADAVQCTLDIIAEHLMAGGRIELRDFGVFEIKERKGGIGRNPRHPEQTVEIPPRKVIKFRAGKNLSEKLA